MHLAKREIKYWENKSMRKEDGKSKGIMNIRKNNEILKERKEKDDLACFRWTIICRNANLCAKSFQILENLNKYVVSDFYKFNFSQIAFLANISC